MTSINPSRIALLAGMKGGTGKSTTALALATSQRAKNQSVAVFDADANVGTTFLTLRDPLKLEVDQDPLRSAVRFDLRDAEEAREVIRVLETGADLAIVDLPGGSIGALEAIFGSEYANGLEELGRFAEDQGHRLTILHMITNDRSTSASLDGFMDGFGASADYVAIHNRGLVRRGEQLTTWLESETRMRFLDMGGREIELPAIPTPLLQLGPSGFCLAHEGESAYVAHLRFLFQKEFAKQFDLIADWL